MDAVETGVVAVADDMTGPSRAHREHKGRDQQDDAGAGGRQEMGWKTLWKGGRVGRVGEGKRAALQRGVASSLTDAVSAAHDQLDGVTRRPLSQKSLGEGLAPGTAASSQPGEVPSNLEAPRSPRGFWNAHSLPSYSEPRPMV